MTVLFIPQAFKHRVSAFYSEFDRTKFCTVFLPCLLVTLSPLSCRNPKIKNLHLSGWGVRAKRPFLIANANSIPRS